MGGWGVKRRADWVSSTLFCELGDAGLPHLVEAFFE